METTIEFIRNLFGNQATWGIVLLIGTLVLCMSAAWWWRGIKDKVSKVDDHEKHLDEHDDQMKEFREAVVKIGSLPCSRHEEDINRHNNEHRNAEGRIVQVETSLVYLKNSLESITRGLQSDSKIIINPYAVNHSPLAITPEGEKMMQRLGVEEMFESNWDRIDHYIDENVEDKNAYDIDKFCQEQAVVYPERFLSKEDIDILKNDAYKEGLSLASYMRVVSVLCRDKFMAKHNIEVSEQPEQKWFWS